MVMDIETMDSVKSGNVLLDFYTPTCGPCKALSPVLEEISEEFKNLKIAKVEVTRNQDMSQMFGVMSVPTMVLLKDYKVKEISRGFTNKKALREMIQKHI